MTEIRPRVKESLIVLDRRGHAAGGRSERDRVEMRSCINPGLAWLVIPSNASNQPVDHSSLTACSTTHLLVTHRLHRGPRHSLFPPLHQDCTKRHRGLARGMVPERVCNVSLSFSFKTIRVPSLASALFPDSLSPPPLMHFPGLWCFWRGLRA